MVTMNTQPLTNEFAGRAASRDQLLRRAGRAFAKMAGWLATCAHYHAAAARYEELAGLSDAELKRRGLSRDTLAKDICESTDRECPP
jgi:hypothetical protein